MNSGHWLNITAKRDYKKGQSKVKPFNKKLRLLQQIRINEISKKGSGKHERGDAFQPVRRRTGCQSW